MSFLGSEFGEFTAEILREAIRILFKASLGAPFDLPLSERNIDERLSKLEAARMNLSEALVAVDELQSLARANKRDLEELNAAITEAERGKGVVSDELAELKRMAALDAETVRKTLRLPTRASVWAERLIGFGTGIAASFLASIAYDFAKLRGWV